MNTFDEIREKVATNLSDWVKINDPKSKWTIDKKGVKITLHILDFPGINEDVGKIYKLKTGWTIFPNGKIKANTIIGGFIK